MVYKDIIVISKLRRDSRFISKNINQPFANKLSLYKPNRVLRTGYSYLIAA